MTASAATNRALLWLLIAGITTAALILGRELAGIVIEHVRGDVGL